jgi:uncharacterized membrane protein
MPDSNQSDDVVRYAAAVRAALAPLPDAERESLLEDLESHLEEVATESALPLRERLGAPEEYAEDLKSAYGAAGVQASPKQSRLIRDRSMALIQGVLGTRTYREMRALLPELRAGWWVLRAYLAVLILAFIFRDGGNLRPIPNPFSSHGLLQIVATVIAIVISVRLGRRGMPTGRVWRGGVMAVNVAIAVLALPVLVSMGTGYSWSPSTDQYLSSVSAGYYPNFTNIYPYSKDGKPLRDVLLYDQDGRPLVPAQSGLITDVPIGADGLPIPNSYPLNQRGPNGDLVLPPRVALPPQRASSPSPSPTPSPTP